MLALTERRLTDTQAAILQVFMTAHLQSVWMVGAVIVPAGNGA